MFHKYISHIVIQLNDAHTSHIGFGRLGRLSEVVAHFLINWAFVVATCKHIIMHPFLGPMGPTLIQIQKSLSNYFATDLQQGILSP